MKKTTQSSSQQIFTAKMESLYYAVKVINSGKVESDLPQIEKILIMALSLPLDKIPIIGDTVKNIFQSFYKKTTVNDPCYEFEKNLNYPSLDEFRVFTEIISTLAEASFKPTEKECRTDQEKAAKKLSKLIVDEFFKFAAKFSIEETADKIDLGQIPEYKKKFISYSYTFLECIGEKINSLAEKKKIPYSFEISPRVVFTHLDELIQIKTIEEQFADLINAQKIEKAKIEEEQTSKFKAFTEGACRMIASKLDGITVEQCMLNAVSC